MYRKQPASRHHTPITGAVRERYYVAYLAPWRACAHLTMEALAERAGVTVQTVFLMEHGRQASYLATVQHIADALGVPRDVLLSYPPTADEAREYVLSLAYRAAVERMPALGVTVPGPEDEPLSPLAPAASMSE